MKTAKGSSYVKVLSGMFFSFDKDLTEMAKAISEIVVAQKRGWKKLEALLEKMDYHARLWHDNATELQETFRYLTEPQQRASAKASAMKLILQKMNDKMLRDFAKDAGVDSLDFILPDEREQLIEAVLKAIEE